MENGFCVSTENDKQQNEESGLRSKARSRPQKYLFCFWSKAKGVVTYDLWIMEGPSLQNIYSQQHDQGNEILRQI